MDDRTLQRKILDMQAELTNLKTAHLHGLGTFEYFTASATYTTTQSPQNFTATVTFEDNSLFPPLLMAAVKQNGQAIEWGWQVQINNNNTISILTSGFGVGTVYEVEVVSTAQIKSITTTQG